MKNSFLGICVLGLFVGACAHAPAVQEVPPLHLAKNRLVYVAQVPGSVEQAQLPVQKAFASALRAYASQVVEGSRPISSEYLVKIAQAMKTGYIFYPKVTQWEDHNTPWTTVRDKVTIDVLVIDAQSGRVILRHSLSGKSKLWVSHNEKPDVVAQDLIENFITALFL